MTNIPLACLCFVSCKFLPEIVNVVGATIVSIFWQTTNVETMRLALKYYDSAYINLLLSIVTFSCFVIMSLYSLLIKAYIMFIPYFYGSILNFINIYIYYWAEKKIKKDDCLIEKLKAILKPETSDDIEGKNENLKNPSFMNNV